MTKHEESTMLACWRDYLNPRDEDEYFDPPPCYIQGYKDGQKEGVQAMRNIRKIYKKDDDLQLKMNHIETIAESIIGGEPYEISEKGVRRSSE